MRVLVVDDDALARELLDLLLDSAGHSTVAVASVREAWAVLREHPPDVILTDLRIDAIDDGLEFLAAIHAEPGLAGLPVIAVTGVTGAGDLARARAAGARLCLPKPVDLARLLAELESIAAGCSRA